MPTAAWVYRMVRACNLHQYFYNPNPTIEPEWVLDPAEAETEAEVKTETEAEAGG